MKKGWWLALAVLVLLLAALVIEWRRQQPREVALPVLNRAAQPVQLLFYGDGLAEHALIPQLEPNDSVVVTLRLSARGAVRIKAESRDARIDSLLAPDNAALRDQPLQFEVRAGNQFVLVPRL